MAYSIDEAKALVLQAGKMLVGSGLVARTWGNISARISDTQFVITPSGLDYEDLTSEKLVIVNIEDISYEGSINPSSEKGIHADAYRLRPEVSFIIHTHQKLASAVSVSGRALELVSDHDRALLGDTVPCAVYGISASPALRRAVEDQLSLNPKCKAFLMKNHGALCLGGSLEEAFTIAGVLEGVAEKCFKKAVSLSDVLPSGGVVLSLQDYSLVRTDYVIHCIAPEVVAVSSRNKALKIYLDDLAQMAGLRVKCVGAGTSKKRISRKLRKKGMLLLDGRGALCAGENEAEARAAERVLTKGCAAALFAESQNAPCLNPIDALLQHVFYKSKYSKQRGK